MENSTKHLEEIKKEIFKRQDEILSRIEKENIDVYLFIKREYKKGNINNNLVFQFIFRSFYKLDNAGLGNELKRKYFELLANKKSDLKQILLELHKILTLKNKNSIQFSFATKLLHTLDNNNPIFDKEVKTVLCKAVYGKNPEEKIKSCLKTYQFLKNIYFELLQDEKIREVIKRFREKFDNKNEISNVKALDFIIWSLGKLKSGHN